MPLTVLLPKNAYSSALEEMLTPLLPLGSVFADPERDLEGLQGRRLLFAVALDEGGCNEAYYHMLSRLRRDVSLLTGCVAGVIVTGVGEFYTKDVARDMVFAANQAGCAFLGRPLVEATGSLRNFRVQAQIGGVNEETAFRASISELIERLAAWESPGPSAIYWPCMPPSAAPPTLWPFGSWCAERCRRRWGWRKSACATAPCPIATAAATPHACISVSRAAAFTEAGPWYRRSILLCADAMRW